MGSLLSWPSQVDVLIAGAGPAGLSAALHLNTSRASVLMVDARRVIGTPLRCGELTRVKFWADLGLEPREGWIRWVLKDQGGAPVLNRPAMERDLARLAADRGAIVREATCVTAVGPFDGDGRRVTLWHEGNSIEVKARCVIAADGVASRVARACGINTDLRLDQLGSCLAYRFAQSWLKTPDFPLVQYLPHRYPYYFWIIPSGPGQASVGMVFPADAGSRLRHLLRMTIERTPQLKGGRVVETVVGAYPIMPPLDQPYADGLLVVGTAARLIYRCTGEGIWPAVLSGRMAAETIAAAASMKAEDLAPYRSGLQPLYDEIELTWNKRRNLAEQHERQ